MGKKTKSAVIPDGSIDTKIIYDTHTKVKEIVNSYREVNLRVSRITTEVNENWVGQGHNEFQSQYNLLIKKIDDFGELLQEIYDSLVDAEASYEDADDSVRKCYVQAMGS